MNQLPRHGNDSVGNVIWKGIRGILNRVELQDTWTYRCSI